jgi:hypothetical protein
VRGLIPQLDAEGIDVLLIDVQEEPGLSVLERFAFRTTPTYLIYDGDGEERLRTPVTPDIATVLEALS